MIKKIFKMILPIILILIIIGLLIFIMKNSSKIISKEKVLNEIVLVSTKELHTCNIISNTLPTLKENTQQSYDILVKQKEAEKLEAKRQKKRLKIK